MTKKTVSVFSILALIACAGLLAGCAVTTTVPISSTMSDHVLFGIKTNRQDTVSYKFASNIQDGEMTLLRHEGSENSAGTVVMHQSSVLKNMIGDYMAVKFSRVSGGSDAEITFTLKDFTVRDVKAIDAHRASVKITAAMNINRAGAEQETKTFIVASERRYIAQSYQPNYMVPHSSPPSESERAALERLYRKRDTSPSRRDALSYCVHDANNKLLLQMNSFFDEINM